MSNPTETIITIIQRYRRAAPLSIGSTTTLRELDIDRLDLPMVLLDIEDAFDIEFQPHSDRESFETVRDLSVFVAARLADKAARPRTRVVTRTSGGWMSTGAMRHR